MPRPRSNKPRKGSGTSFGKRSDAEKSYRKKDSSSRPDSDSKRSFSKPSGYRKSNAGSSFRPAGSSFKKSGSESFGVRPGKDDDRKKREDFRPRPENGAGGFKKDFKKGGDFRKRFSDQDRTGPSKPYGADRGKRPFHSGDRNESAPNRGESRGNFKKPFRKADDDKRPGGGFSNNPDKKSFGKEERKSFVQSRVVSISDFTKPGRKPKEDGFNEKPTREKSEGSFRDKTAKEKSPKEESGKADGLSRLNKYIANSGVGSRRDADKLITMGLISVNGVTITELGTKVKAGDVVRYEDRILKAEKPVYILLNKPKGFITTTDDPQERNTVMGLVAGACKERIYPVGRLDRNTTGLLLLTNDGDLADKLTHPSYKAKKVYKVELDKPLTKNDFQKIVDGVHLEEGRALVDDLAIISDDNKTIGLEIHIGWNRVVRRIFETLGYAVVRLDRSVYAGLDKKDTPRGNWRFLKPEEIVMLKHFK